MRTAITQTTIRITRKGELQYFQLRLPRGTKHILGVEAVAAAFASAPPVVHPPASFLASFAVKPSRMAGQLRLQQVGRGGLLYAGAVHEQDSTRFYADYSLFAPNDWSHHGKHEEDELLFPCESHIVLGLYQDVIGRRQDTHLNYTVQVYLWLASETETEVAS